MRMLIVAFALLGVAVVAVADEKTDKKDAIKLIPIKKADGDKKDVEKKDSTKQITLKVGDKAPELKATKWLQGDEVKSFEAGKIYVVEFWATWCGPCIVMMPHLSELQSEYKSKGVTFIGYSPKDQNNSEEKVTAFVKKRGEKLKYTFAYAEDRDTHKAWMVAAGRGGIPCSFVVDKDSKIAYIGHPMYLDVVLPKVVDGTWKADKGVEEVAKIEKEVNGLFRTLNGKDTKAAITAITEFEKTYPPLSKIPYFIGPKLNLLVKEKPEEARKMGEKLLTGAVKQDDSTVMRTVSVVMRSPDARKDKDNLALSLKAAEAVVKCEGEKDPMALYNLADTYFVSGNAAKALEYGKKAVEAADNPAMKRFLETRLKAFEPKKSDD